MKKSISIIFCLIIMCVSCSKTKNTKAEINDGKRNTADTTFSIQSQAFLDSAFAVFGENPEKSAAIFMTPLKGAIKTVTYESCIFSPYTTSIELDMFGNIYDITCTDDTEGNIEVKRIPNTETDTLRLGFFISTWVRLEFSRILAGNTQEIYSSGDLCNLNYTLHYNADNILNKVVLLAECYEDMGSSEKSVEKRSYKVKANDVDSHGNWTSLSMTTKDTLYNENMKRRIDYYDTTELWRAAPKLISTTSTHKVFGYYPAEYSGYNIVFYDCDDNKWAQLVPPDFDSPEIGFRLWRYKDYRVVDNHLYLIFDTEACGGGIIAAYAVYYYDTTSDTWNKISYCGDCEFVDNKIKIIGYEIVKEGDCTANNEYKEVIEWRELK